MLSLYENVVLALHDTATKMAAMCQLNPEIRSAAMTGRAEIKDSRLHLASVKADAKKATRELKEGQALERLALYRRQKAEMENLRVENLCKVEDSREAVKTAKQKAALRLEDIRARHEMERLQARLQRHNVSFTAPVLGPSLA